MSVVVRILATSSYVFIRSLSTLPLLLYQRNVSQQSLSFFIPFPFNANPLLSLLLHDRPMVYLFILQVE